MGVILSRQMIHVLLIVLPTITTLELCIICGKTWLERCLTSKSVWKGVLRKKVLERWFKSTLHVIEYVQLNGPHTECMEISRVDQSCKSGNQT